MSAFVVERTLGSGGMGWVFGARDARDQREVALKVLREDQLAQASAIDRMRREAQILATVQHAGIPRLHDHGVLPDGRPWIAMDLCAGDAFSTLLSAGPVGHDVVLDVVERVAQVLATAHARGVVHRDLKPDNILVSPEDARFPVRVIDWGIALDPTGARLTHHDEAIGTPTYMSPEQARGDASTGASDIYGLGVVAYQALCGTAPFLGESSIEILVQHLSKRAPLLAPRCPHAPSGLVDLVEIMLSKRPDERPCAEAVCELVQKSRRRR